jgi:hypothetical protein
MLFAEETFFYRICHCCQLEDATWFAIICPAIDCCRDAAFSSFCDIALP